MSNWGGRDKNGPAFGGEWLPSGLTRERTEGGVVQPVCVKLA